MLLTLYLYDLGEQMRESPLYLLDAKNSIRLIKITEKQAGPNSTAARRIVGWVERRPPKTVQPRGNPQKYPSKTPQAKHLRC